VILAADRDEMDFLKCVYKPGARLSEILNLKWDDVNLQIKSVRLWTRKRKGGGWQARILKMPRQMHEILTRRYENRNKRPVYVFCQPNGDPFTQDCNWIRELMKRLCTKAGVKKFTFHAFRHRISTNLMDSGEATLGMIQEFLGHQRKSTIEGYLTTLDRGAVDVADIIDSMHEGAVQNKSEFGE
jgi:integrase